MAVGDRYIPMSFYDSLADARKTLRENSLLSLEAQIDLADWLERANSALAYQQFMRVYGYRKIEDMEQRATLGTWLHQRVKDVVSQAATYYVSPDMCEMTRMAAEALPAEALSPKDLPVERGFLYFARPMIIDGPAALDDEPSERTEKVAVSAVAWENGMVGHPEQGVAPGVSYWLFQTVHDAAVTINRGLAREWEERTGQKIVEPVVVTGSGAQDGPFVTDTELKAEHGPLPIYDFSGWTYGSTWNSSPVSEAMVENPDGSFRVSAHFDEEGQLQVHPVVDQVRRYLLATWKLLQEKITDTDIEHAPRYIRRRAERRIPEAGDIVVVRLRKETKGSLVVENPEEGPWWNHRWLVRGHWHKYWVGPKAGEQSLVTKWVAPYIKGPEGAPFVAKDRIFSLER